MSIFVSQEMDVQSVVGQISRHRSDGLIELLNVMAEEFADVPIKPLDDVNEYTRDFIQRLFQETR